MGGRFEKLHGGCPLSLLGVETLLGDGHTDREPELGLFDLGCGSYGLHEHRSDRQRLEAETGASSRIGILPWQACGEFVCGNL